MKKIILVLFTGVLTACGGGEEKKKGFEYNRTKTEESKTISKKESTPIDLSNKGIGPIKSMRFDDSINEELVHKVQLLLSKSVPLVIKPMPN